MRKPTRSAPAKNLVAKYRNTYATHGGGIGKHHHRAEAPTVFRIFDGIESIEMHANAIVSQGGTGVRSVITEDAKSATGREAICGTNNWIPARLEA